MVKHTARHCQRSWVRADTKPHSWAGSMLIYWVNVGNNQHLPYKAISVLFIAQNSMLNQVWIFWFNICLYFLYTYICMFNLRTSCIQQFSSQNCLHPQILLYLFQTLNSLMKMCFHLTAAYVGLPGSLRAVTVISTKTCKPEFILATTKRGLKCLMETDFCKNFDSFAKILIHFRLVSPEWTH